MMFPSRFYALVGIAIVIGVPILLWLAFRMAPPEVVTQPPSPVATSTATSTGGVAVGQPPAKPPAPGATPQPAKPKPTPQAGCALQFSVTPASKTVQQNGTIIYSLGLVNAGNTACTNTSISAYYADNETFVSATPKATADGYYWSIGSLAPGARFAASVTTKQNGSTAKNSVANEMCATADNGKDACADTLVFIGTGGPTYAPPVAVQPPTTGTVWGTNLNRSKELGIWVWNYPDQMNGTEVGNLLGALSRNSFNAVYLTVDNYLDIASLPAGANRTAKSKAYMASLASFVGKAKDKGIAVDIEGGANDWAVPANRWKGYALIDFLKDYNAAYPNAPVRGFQYDVESYLLPDYQKHQAVVLQDFVDFISESASRMQSKNPQQRFSVVVPHFYDSDIGWTAQVSYKGATEYTYNALLRALSQKPNSELIVMAYRNHVDGQDGSEDLASAEIKQANGFSTKVIVAQETGDVQPSYVTFFGKSKRDLADALAQIEKDFGGYSSFGGVAVHYVDSFMKLQ
jgi:hypothetical protein